MSLAALTLRRPVVLVNGEIDDQVLLAPVLGGMPPIMADGDASASSRLRLAVGALTTRRVAGPRYDTRFRVRDTVDSEQPLECNVVLRPEVQGPVEVGKVVSDVCVFHRRRWLAVLDDAVNEALIRFAGAAGQHEDRLDDLGGTSAARRASAERAVSSITS